MVPNLIHQLHYSWAGWPSSGAFPNQPETDFFEPLDAAWQADGLQRISHRWTPGQIQISFKAEPAISPVLVASRAKGRLDHALRQHGTPSSFSRKVGFRTMGRNNTGTVLDYLANQYERSDLADPRYVASLQAASWENPDFDLSDPMPTSHGRYWYELHIVCVTNGRVHLGRGLEQLTVRNAILAWGAAMENREHANKSGTAKPGIRSLAVMHDHLHIAVRGPIDLSPLDMAMDLVPRLNRACGCALFSDRVYVGSFSEYTLHALG